MYLEQTGPAVVDYTVKLIRNEIASIKSGMYKAKSLLGSFDSSRFVKPAIWPQSKLNHLMISLDISY